MAPGTLYLVATPIGNLEDIGPRALRTLREVALIACEDTRHSARLLHHYGITTPRESCHEHNEARRVPRLLAMLREGKSVALISDAGMPLLSDPGHDLVAACLGEHIPIVPIPGACAAIAALSASGLPSDSFMFAGFLPPKSGARRRRLEELAELPCTLILYEAPHRILASLEDMILVLGPRQACLARELTKLHEEWLRDSLDRILENLRRREKIQGEITLVIAGRDDSKPSVVATGTGLEEHVRELETRLGLPRREALRRAARERGIKKRDAYRLLLDQKNAAGGDGRE